MMWFCQTFWKVWQIYCHQQSFIIRALLAISSHCLFYTQSMSLWANTVLCHYARSRLRHRLLPLLFIAIKRYFLGAIWAQYSRRHPLLPAILLSAFERIILRAISARIYSIRQFSCQVCTTSFVLLIAAAAACDHSRCLSDFCIMQQPISVTAALA